jgi:hypothetical protein
VSRFSKFWSEVAAGEAQPVCPSGQLAVAAPLLSMPQRDSSVVVLNRTDGSLQTLDDHYLSASYDPPDGSTASFCTVIVTRAVPLRVALSSLPRMAYHFYREALQQHARTFIEAGAFLELATHIWTPGGAGEVSAFSEVFQAASNNCMRPADDLPADVTVCYRLLKPDSRVPRADFTVKEHGGADDGTVQLLTWDIERRGFVRQAGAPPGVVVESALEAATEGGHRRGLAGLVRDGVSDYNETVEFLSSFETALDTDVFALSTIWIHFLQIIFGLRGARAPGSGPGPDVLLQRHSTSSVGASQALRGIPSTTLSHTSTLPTPLQPLQVVLISRRNKRVLLNEPELIAETASAHPGLQLTVAVLEEMALFEQMQLLWRTDVLIGVHGSGLINSIFMRTGSVLVELVPFRVSTTGFFDGPAAEHRVHYLSWTNQDPQRSRFHWHFVGSDVNQTEEVDPALAGSLKEQGYPDYFSFWINQDMRIPRDEWSKLLNSAAALARGPPPPDLLARTGRPVNEPEAVGPGFSNAANQSLR